MTATASRKRAFAEARAVPCAGGFGVYLDEKAIRTPAGRQLVVPAAPLAAALAEEWNALGDTIDPLALPLTRLANTALDGATAHRAAIEADLLRHGRDDLVCYRADTPDNLVALQSEHWDPLVAWAAQKLGVRLAVTTGIAPITQPPDVFDIFSREIKELDDFSLTTLHLVAGLTASLVIALATLRGVIDAEAAFAAAFVDDTWQARQWGVDDEAKARLERRRDDLAAAVRFAVLARAPLPE